MASIICFFIGADPTIKDSSGHQAIDYAGSTKIKEFLTERMDMVIGLYLLTSLLTS